MLYKARRKSPSSFSHSFLAIFLLSNGTNFFIYPLNSFVFFFFQKMLRYTVLVFFNQMRPICEHQTWVILGVNIINWKVNVTSINRAKGPLALLMLVTFTFQLIMGSRGVLRVEHPKNLYRLQRASRLA